MTVTLSILFSGSHTHKPPLVHSITVSSLHGVILGRMTSCTKVTLFWPYPVFVFVSLWLPEQERLLVSGTITGHNHSEHPIQSFISLSFERFPIQLFKWISGRVTGPWEGVWKAQSKLSSLVQCLYFFISS